MSIGYSAGSIGSAMGGICSTDPRDTAREREQSALDAARRAASSAGFSSIEEMAAAKNIAIAKTGDGFCPVVAEMVRLAGAGWSIYATTDWLPAVGCGKSAESAARDLLQDRKRRAMAALDADYDIASHIAGWTLEEIAYFSDEEVMFLVTEECDADICFEIRSRAKAAINGQ